MIEKSQLTMPKGSLLMLILFIGVLCSAIMVVYTSHKNRLLLNELYQNLAIYNKGQSEWGRLTLEHSTWTSYGRVEKIAIDQLGMHVPVPKEVRMIGQ